MLIAQSAGTVEYTDCIPVVEGKTPPHVSPGYRIKQSDGEASAVEL